MALCFILSIDELLLATMASTTTLYILDHLENYENEDDYVADNETDAEVLARYRQEELVWRGPLVFIRKFLWLFPYRLCMMLALLLGWLAVYYNINCKRDSEDTFVSKDLYLPTSLDVSLLQLLFGGGAGEVERKPVWFFPGG